MGRVRQRDTDPELRVRRALHAAGLRFRVQRRDLPGRPDIVLPRHRIAIFVHGCFWHRHPGCRMATMPKTRADFWSAKFERNVQRDESNVAQLIALGWRVVVVWECETKSVVSLANALDEGLQPLLSVHPGIRPPT
jgi:DNA mismatch endonuclease (patch repair protein)